MGKEEVVPWSDAQSVSDASKKEIVEFLQGHATAEFLKEHKCNGKSANVIKTAKKDDLVTAYMALLALGTSAFRDASIGIEEELSKLKVSSPSDSNPVKEISVASEPVPEGPPKYTKVVLRKGDAERPVKKGRTVGCLYTGYLPNGDVFDTNTTKKKPVPLKFKVGVGRVIKGWDEALLTMTAGEKARVVILSEWAYGKKGAPPKIPPNTDLTFEIEVMDVD